MAFTPPAYPAVLTKANWDKNKGVVAKMAGATGVGDALSKLEAAYKAVDWKKFADRDQQAGPVQPAQARGDEEGGDRGDERQRREAARGRVRRPRRRQEGGRRPEEEPPDQERRR